MAAVPLARPLPSATVTERKLVQNPRRPCGDHSSRKEAATPHSPPAEKPCTSRATSSSTGAMTPIVW